MFQLEQLDHVAMLVSDLERSKQWYCDVLGFEHRFEGLWDGVPVMVGLGDTLIALFPSRGDQQAEVPKKAIRIAHVAFRTDRENFLSAREDLAAQGILVTFQDHDISHSIYFNDPDGHQLEITTYDLG